MGKIYMTACMKGGCAKTVTTYNLAYSLKELGKKVLCVDFDSQANLSTCFGVENPVAVPVTIGHLMMAQIDDDELPGFKEYIQSRNGVDFISSSMMLFAVDAKLRLEMGAENGIEQIAIDSIKAFHNHPFHLYEGERLNDMVESIREHGILNPVIVLKTDNGYEMLSGHNRANAAKIAGLSEVPAIIKVGLSESEAYVYVIETNLMQRSFAELLQSEKAAVMAAHYDKVCCQGKRNDIIRELQILSGIEPEETSCHNGKKLNSLDVIASEYDFSSRNAARYLRLNYLIQPFKNLMDENKIALLAAVNVSYMTKEEQQMLWNIVDRQGLKVKPVYAEKLRKASGDLTEEKMAEILEALQVKHTDGNAGVSFKLPKSICSKYFDGMDSKQMATVVEQVLAAWFEGKEATVV